MDAIASADLNGDGVPDLVVGDLGGEFQTYLGRGDGTFQPLATISDKPMEPLLILIGDLNRDGVPDLVLAGIKDPGTGETTAIRVRLGKGDGTFGLPLDVNEDFGNFLIERMLLADFNGDGIPDLAVEAPDPVQPGNTRLSIFFGKGDGTFQMPVYPALSHTALGGAGGDFNGDGIIDLGADTDGLATTGNVSILLGNGNGTFRNSTSYTAGSGVGSFAVADFNRDGIPDFVAIHDGTVTLFLGNGDGTFREQADTVATTGNPLIADLNGDGFPDLIMSGPSVSVAMNNGNGTFQPQLFFPVGGAAALAVADFDSDGHPDIAVTNNGRALSLLLSRGAGSADGRDFQLNLSAASITVRAGQSATSTVFVTAMGSFKDSVTFSCAGLPAGATCSFSPATMTPPAHGTRNVTLTIAVSNAQTARLSPGTQGSIMFALGLPIFGIVIIRLRRRGRWKGSAGVVLLIAAMVTLGGCAGIGSVDNHRNTVGTPAGVFTITVIGTSGGSVVITRMQTMVLKVQ